jgi:hypothetical protein
MHPVSTNECSREAVMNNTHSLLSIMFTAAAVLALLITVGAGTCRRVHELHTSTIAQQEAAEQQLPGSYVTMLNTLNTIGWR